MAVIRVNYVKKGKGERRGAKANVRYIEHRPGKDGARIWRTLFGNEGTAMNREEVYRMIDEAEWGSTFFRIKICPDAKTEDSQRDLSIQEVVEKTMRELEDQIKRNISWIAAVHQDHTPLRHAHILAVVRERSLPVQAMRQSATEACLMQRRELDQIREHRQQEQEREGEQWERQQEQEKGGVWQ